MTRTLRDDSDTYHLEAIPKASTLETVKIPDAAIRRERFTMVMVSALFGFWFWMSP